MAISLKSLTKPTQRPVIITLVGEGGIGKSSLGANFPNPVFIRTEDGTQSISHRDDVALFPVANTYQDVIDAMQALATEEHSFKTLVLDSITQLNVLAEAEVVMNDPKCPKGINQALGGFGNGHAAVSDMHRMVREAAGWLVAQKNMNVVFIAHAIAETVDPPDTDSYTRYSIRMNARSVAHYSDNVDLVGFIKLRTFTRGEGNVKKATTTGERIITCYPTANHISKNRFGIKEDLVFAEGTNPFVSWIPALQTSNTSNTERKANKQGA
ncbi:MAG: hypothetical protein CR991_10300 [Proteobacteria bacterium]|nr:MAG: hypothetical protein CR991_10300 [Pseudomonadota bacterium]